MTLFISHNFQNVALYFLDYSFEFKAYANDFAKQTEYTRKEQIMKWMGWL